MPAARQKGTTVASAIDKLDTKSLLTLAGNLSGAQGLVKSDDLADSLAAFEEEAKASLRSAFGVPVKSLSV